MKPFARRVRRVARRVASRLAPHRPRGLTENGIRRLNALIDDARTDREQLPGQFAITLRRVRARRERLFERLRKLDDCRRLPVAVPPPERVRVARFGPGGDFARDLSLSPNPSRGREAVPAGGLSSGG